MPGMFFRLKTFLWIARSPIISGIVSFESFYKLYDASLHIHWKSGSRQYSKTPWLFQLFMILLDKDVFSYFMFYFYTWSNILFDLRYY